MGCHVWDGSSACRTEIYPKLKQVQVCDYCKTVLQGGKKIGQEYYYEKTDEILLVDEWSIIDVRQAGYKKQQQKNI